MLLTNYVAADFREPVTYPPLRCVSCYPLLDGEYSAPGTWAVWVMYADESFRQFHGYIWGTCDMHLQRDIKDSERADDEIVVYIERQPV